MHCRTWHRDSGALRGVVAHHEARGCTAELVRDAQTLGDEATGANVGVEADLDAVDGEVASRGATAGGAARHVAAAVYRDELRSLRSRTDAHVLISWGFLARELDGVMILEDITKTLQCAGEGRLLADGGGQCLETAPVEGVHAERCDDVRQPLTVEPSSPSTQAQSCITVLSSCSARGEKRKSLCMPNSFSTVD
eukprot:3938002-Rhodomonas_salina.2